MSRSPIAGPCLWVLTTTLSETEPIEDCPWYFIAHSIFLYADIHAGSSFYVISSIWKVSYLLKSILRFINLLVWCVHFWIFGLAAYSEYILHILFFMYQLRVYILYFWAMMQTNSFKIVLIFSFISSNFFVQNIFAQIFTIVHLTVCLVVSHSNFSSCCTYSEFTFVIEWIRI